MSVELAEAYLSLRSPMPGVKGGVASALGAVDADGAGRAIGKRASDGTSSGMSVVLKGGVAGLAAGLAMMLVRSVGSLTSEAVVASDATSKFKQTLNFAGIDTTAIDGLTKSTQLYADETVYDLATIQNTVAQLAANGVKDYDKLAEAGGNLNAVAGGNAETFKSVGMVLTQTAGAGKLTTENWNQLANAIPGAAGVLQEALLTAGAYTGNFREAMEKGEISADEFNAAIMQIGTDPIAVEAAKSTATFEGAIGSLQATIVGGLTGALNALKPALTGVIAAVAGGLPVVFGFFAQAHGVDLGGIFALLGYLSPIGATLHVLGPVLPLVLGALQEIAGVLTVTWAGNLTLIADTLAGVGVIFAGVLANVLPILLPALIEFTTACYGLTAQILPMLLPVIVSLAALFGTLLASILPLTTAFWDAATAIITALIPVVMLLLTAVIPLISAFATTFAPVLIAVASKLADVLVPAIGGMVERIQWLAGIVTWVVQSLIVPWFTTIVAPGIALVGDVLRNVFSGLSGFFAGIWDTLGAGFRSLVNHVIDWINSYTAGINQVGAVVSGATGGAIDLGVRALPHLADGATVLPRQGGTLAVLAERGRAESVVDTALMRRALRTRGWVPKDGDRALLHLGEDGPVVPMVFRNTGISTAGTVLTAS